MVKKLTKGRQNELKKAMSYITEFIKRSENSYIFKSYKWSGPVILFEHNGNIFLEYGDYCLQRKGNSVYNNGELLLDADKQIIAYDPLFLRDFNMFLNKALKCIERTGLSIKVLAFYADENRWNGFGMIESESEPGSVEITVG